MITAVTGTRGGVGASTIARSFARYLELKHPEANQVKYVNMASCDMQSGETDCSHPFYPFYRWIPKWNRSKCSYCNKCIFMCMSGGIVRYPDSYLVYPENCISCRSCKQACPNNALEMQRKIFGELRYFKNNNYHLQLYLNSREILSPVILKEAIQSLRKSFSSSRVLIDVPSATLPLFPILLKYATKIILVVEEADEMERITRHFPDEAGKVILVVPEHVVPAFVKHGSSTFSVLPFNRSIALGIARNEFCEDIPEYREMLESLFIKTSIL